MINKTLNARPDLIKARVNADLPPEVLEPLYAFLGHGPHWNFDARTNLHKQLDMAQDALKWIEKSDIDLKPPSRLAALLEAEGRSLDDPTLYNNAGGGREPNHLERMALKRGSDKGEKEEELKEIEAGDESCFDSGDPYGKDGISVRSMSR